jgi:hypothetical protein
MYSSGSAILPSTLANGEFFPDEQVAPPHVDEA